MKSKIKFFLQRLLGFDNYLFIFSLFVIYKLKWDKNERDFLFFLKLIKNDSIILDIGANIGIMSVHFARRFKKSTIYAFEPIPFNIKAMKRVIRHFKLKNITVLNHALGNETGMVEMVVPVIDKVKMQGLSHVVHETIDENNSGEKIKVSIKKLDDIAELFNSKKRIGAIKIDVENFEYFVLKGGQKLIKKNKPLIYCELWDNENRRKCLDLLDELGYNAMVIDNEVLMKFNEQIHTTQNFFFISKTESENTEA